MDILIIHAHNDKEMNLFLKHMNNQQQRIQSIIEKEHNKLLHLLDILLDRSKHGKPNPKYFLEIMRL